MGDLKEKILGLFSEYGLGAVFGGVMLENAGIPMASEVTLLLAGSMVAGGVLGWLPVVLTAAVAAILSDSFWYFVGRIGAARLVQLYCRFSFGSAACTIKAREMLLRFGPRSLIVARFVPGFRTFASPMAGISGLSWPQFLLYDSIGALLWASTVVSGGWLLAEEINRVFEQMQSAHSALLTVAGAMVLIFIALKLWIRARHGKAQYAPTDAAPGKEA